MPRIRTIKPEFFRHEGLQDLEIANPGKHVMLVFVGLWTLCDNQGVFEWRPRQIVLDILPFVLRFQIEESLNLLLGAGFIGKFEHDGKQYGYVPTFSDHQRLNGKEASEAGTKYPPPPSEDEPAETPENTEGSSGEATGKQRGSSREAAGKQPAAQEMEEEKEKEKEREGRECAHTHARAREDSDEIDFEDLDEDPPPGSARPPSANLDPEPAMLGEPDWMQVAQDMAAYALSEEGASQWAFMCEAAGARGHPVDPLPITTAWAGKHADGAYMLANWRKQFPKLTNWIKNELRAQRQDAAKLNQIKSHAKRNSADPIVSDAVAAEVAARVAAKRRARGYS